MPAYEVSYAVIVIKIILGEKVRAGTQTMVKYYKSMTIQFMGVVG